MNLSSQERPQPLPSAISSYVNPDDRTLDLRLLNMLRPNRQYSDDSRRSKLPTQAGSLMTMIKPPSPADTLAANIEWLLSSRDMKIGELADRSGVSIGAIFRMRRRQNTTLDTIEKVAAVFRYKASDLLDPDLRSDSDLLAAANRLKRAYLESSPEAQKMMESVAEYAEKSSGSDEPSKAA